MAPIEHADSIIDESVISTSPSRHVDTDNEASTGVAEPSLPRRVIKTYGRPKVDQIGHDNTENIYENRAHTLRTAPPDTERLVIPESEDASAYSGTSVPSFGWREQLRQIDEDYSEQSKRELCATIITPSGSFVDADLKDASGSLFDGTLSSLLSEVPRSPSEKSDIEDTGNVEMDMDELFRPITSSSSHGKVTGTNDSPRNESLNTPPTSPLTLTTISAKDSKVRPDEKPKYQKGIEKQRPRKSSKKELTEMQKESARLLAERTVEIKRQEQRPGPSLRHLFGILKLSTTSTKLESKDSDPIISFSSPDNSNFLQKVEDSDKAGAISPNFLRHSTPWKQQTSLNHEDPERDSDIEMPTAESILETEYPQLAEKCRAKELKERKLQALQASKVTSTSSSDDDLEVEQMVTPGSRRSRIKTIGNVSGFKPESKYKRDSEHKQNSGINLELAAKPLFDVKRSKTDKSGHKNTVSHRSLNHILLHRAEKQSSEIEGKKKEKWIQRGGSLKVTTSSEGSSLGSWLSRGLGGDAQGVDTEAENEDERHYEDEYQPSEERDDEQSDNGSTIETLEDIIQRDISNESVIADEDDDEDKENQQPLPRRAGVPVIVDSDDENDPMSSKFNQPLVLARDSHPLGTTDSNSEGEDDHDEDEEKENQKDEPFRIAFISTVESGVARPISRKPSSVFNEDLLEENESPLSRTGCSHRILRVLHEEDKENTFESDHSSPSDRVIGSPFSTPVENFEGSTLVSSESFSQLFTNTEKITDKEPSPTPLLGKGFSQFFSPSGGKSQEQPLGISIGKFGVPFQLTKDKNFEFTQANALLPSIQISESQRREVDDMFNKDQEFKLDEAKRAKTEAEPSSSKRTKMAYFGSFIASPQTDISHMIRQPLATMSLMSVERPEENAMVDEESSPQFKRTRLRRERPQARSESPTPIAMPKVRNAFELLKDAGISKHKKGAAKTVESDYIQGEAQESDDELYAGFGGKEKDDEDDENEDQDAIIEGLVDDAELDDKTMATELVLEKHKEFEAQDDAVLMKLHQDAIEGKLRTKRKNGGLEFDDSESEDEHRPPKHFLKKRRIEGDTLDACAQNPETRAFFDAYQKSLLDEDQLNIGPLVQPPKNEPQEDMSEEDSDDGEETIDVSIIRDELRKRALNHEDEMVRADLEDVTWLDADERQASDDINIQVEQEGMLQGNSKLQNTHLSTLRFNGDFVTKNATSQEKTRLQAWASQESQTRTAGGRGGFSRRDEKEKSTVGSRKSSNSHKYPTPSHMPDKFRKSSTTSSLISHVQKQKRFED